MNVDQKSLETEFSIAICRPTGDKWQSKTLLLAIFDQCSSIVKSVFDCRLPGVSMRYPVLFQFPIPRDESTTHCVVFNMSEIAIMKYHIVKVSSTLKVSKGAKIGKRYNQVPHMTQSTNGKVTNSQLDTTNESQKVILFPAVYHRAHINRRAQRHSKHKTEKT